MAPGWRMDICLRTTPSISTPISPHMDHALRIAESIMKARHFYHQFRSRVAATGPTVFADEDEGQIETWMIGHGQELSGNRRTIARTPWCRQ